MKVQKHIILQKNLISTQMMHLIFYGILVYGLCIYFRNMCPGNDKYKKIFKSKTYYFITDDYFNTK